MAKREGGMTEPISAAAASAVGAAQTVAGKAALAKLAAIFATGAVGAAVMAALRPVTARQLFVQAAVAGVVSVYFAESVIDWFPALRGFTLQVAFLLGAMSWGIVGALVRLRDLIDKRGARVIAARVGIDATE